MKRLYPRVRKEIPIAQQWYNNWCREHTPRRATPITWGLLQAFAGLCLHLRWMRLACILLISFVFYLRTGEALALRKSDILCNLADGSIVIRIASSKTSKNDQQSLAHFDLQLAQLLSALLRNFDPDEELWPFSMTHFRNCFTNICSFFDLQPLGLPWYPTLSGAGERPTFTWKRTAWMLWWFVADGVKPLLPVSTSMMPAPHWLNWRCQPVPDPFFGDSAIVCWFFFLAAQVANKIWGDDVAFFSFFYLVLVGKCGAGCDVVKLFFAFPPAGVPPAGESGVCCWTNAPHPDLLWLCSQKEEAARPLCALPRVFSAPQFHEFVHTPWPFSISWPSLCRPCGGKCGAGCDVVKLFFAFPPAGVPPAGESGVCCWTNAPHPDLLWLCSQKEGAARPLCAHIYI